MQIKTFVFNMFAEKTYLIWDETSKHCAIIDAGCFYPDEQAKLSEFIKEHSLIPTHLLNTHLHLDHIFGNAYVHKTYGLLPQASRADEFLLDSFGEQCHMFGFPTNEPTVRIGTYLEEGQQIKIGETEIEILHIPGHSPGSLAFYIPSQGCVFSGDALFCGSMGRTDLPGGNYGELLHSIRTKLFTLPPATIVYAGHDVETTIGQELRTNPFFQ